MRKRIILCLIAGIVLICIPMSAMAWAPAVPNQKLSFRTGPNTKYVSLYTLPQSTSISAIEYEEGNGVTWVLVQFTHNGRDVCAYTGLKRMRVSGEIPWASHQYDSVYCGISTQVYAAPTYNGENRGWLNDGESMSLLRYDGDFAFIEFYDGGVLSRGWVPADTVSYGGCDDGGPSNCGEAGVPAKLNQEMALRTGPNTKYAWMYHMPQDTPIRAIEYEEGNGVTWVLVEFFKDGERVRGYTGLKRMSVYGDLDVQYGYYWETAIDLAGFVYAAPTYDAAIRAEVNEGDPCKLLYYEKDFAYIEFYDREAGALSRGYVETFRIR